MTIRSIFLFAPAETASAAKGAPAFAIGLARATAARLTVFCVALDVTTPGRQSDPAAVAAAITASATAAGVDCEVISEHSHAIGIHEAVAAHARLHDLTVIGADGSGLLSERIVAEHLLFDSGRPVIVVPAGHAGDWQGGTVVAAWDGTTPAARALGDAIALLDPARLHLLSIEGEKALMLEPALDRAATLLGKRGPAITTATAAVGNRSIADALQDEALAQGGVLLVMGAFAHSRMRSLVMGSATTGVLAKCRMPVLFSH